MKKNRRAELEKQFEFITEKQDILDLYDTYRVALFKDRLDELIKSKGYHPNESYIEILANNTLFCYECQGGYENVRLVFNGVRKRSKEELKEIVDATLRKEEVEEKALQAKKEKQRAKDLADYKKLCKKLKIKDEIYKILTRNTQVVDPS